MLPQIIRRSFANLAPFKKCHESQFFQRLIPPSEYCDRQKKLVKLIEDHTGQQRNQFFGRNKDSLIVVSGAKRMYTADTRIPTIHFKQNSDFLYLTGLNTKEAAHTVLILHGQGSSFQSYLFLPFATDLQLIWEGEGLRGSHYRQHVSSITNHLEDITKLPQFLEQHSNCNIFLCRAGLELIPPSISGHKEINESSFPRNPLAGFKTIDLSPFIDKLRLLKSPSEMDCMRRSCAIGGKAINLTRCWSQTQAINNQNFAGVSGVGEGQIAAKFEYEARINGAVKPSYPPVVAGGERSTIVHYGANDKFVNPNEWILMDAGCEDVEGYISDITRCWPINGSSDNAKCRLTQALHEALCEVNEQIVAYLSDRIQETSLNDLYHLMCHFLGAVLAEFGLCSKGDQATLMADHFCPHHVSHYLGLDVHDTPTINRDITLQPGMCFTIEPGLYFRPNDKKVKKDFEGIGLRVEDNFIINEHGQLENLTRDCPHIFSPNQSDQSS